jgi:hypothetical protein
MIRVMAANKRNAGDPDVVHGKLVGEFDTYSKAFNEVGNWIDRGAADETICFYFSDDQRLQWTLVANLV